MSSFKKWWKLNGQGIGFIVGIVYLNAYFLLLGDRIQAGDLTADLLETFTESNKESSPISSTLFKNSSRFGINVLYKTINNFRVAS